MIKMENKKRLNIKENSKEFSSLINFIKNKKFIITKKIAKHGNQSVIVIPKAIENSIPPGTLAQITIDVIETEENNEDKNGGRGK